MDEKEKELLNKIDTGAKVEDNTQDYLNAIKDLKQNSVSRSEYDKLKAENKELINSLVNGQVVTNEPAKEMKDINKLRKELFNPDKELSNLEYATKALELRDALIESGEADPFLPIGSKYTPRVDDINTANKVAEVLKECIEYAEGDTRLFTSELDRRTNDVKIYSNRRKVKNNARIQRTIKS